MRVVVDKMRCMGSTACASVAAALFEIDLDEGVAVLIHQPSLEEEAAARTAVAACPSGAIRIEEDK